MWCFSDEDRESDGGILFVLEKERAAIAMKFPGTAIRCKNGASSNELDIWPPPPKPEGRDYRSKPGSSLLFSLAMGFGHCVEPRALGDVGVVRLVAFLLKQARNPVLDWKNPSHCRRRPV
jgi:hypothetical protein